MPKVKVTASLAGDAFSYSAGQIVDKEIFEAQVGTGWDALCVDVDTDDDVKPEEEVVVSASEPEKAPTTKRKRGPNA